jgi:hypothetical protein
LEIQNPNEDDEFEIGRTINVDIRVENNFGEDQDVDVEVHLYDLDEDESIVEEGERISINEGDSALFDFVVKVPEDLDLDNDFVLYVKAEDEICTQDYIKLDLERPEDMVIISDVVVPSSVFCGEEFDVVLEVKNLGSKDQDVSVSLESFELEIDEESEEFILEEFDDDDMEKREFTFVVPYHLTTGVYEIGASVSYGVNSEAITRSLEVVCRAGGIVGSALEAQEIDDALSLESYAENDGGGSLLFFLMIMSELILLGGFGVIYLVKFRKK